MNDPPKWHIKVWKLGLSEPALAFDDLTADEVAGDFPIHIRQGHRIANHGPLGYNGYLIAWRDDRDGTQFVYYRPSV